MAHHDIWHTSHKINIVRGECWGLTEAFVKGSNKGFSANEPPWIMNSTTHVHLYMTIMTVLASIGTIASLDL